MERIQAARVSRPSTFFSASARARRGERTSWNARSKSRWDRCAGTMLFPLHFTRGRPSRATLRETYVKNWQSKGNQSLFDFLLTTARDLVKYALQSLVPFVLFATLASGFMLRPNGNVNRVSPYFGTSIHSGAAVLGVMHPDVRPRTCTQREQAFARPAGPSTIVEQHQFSETFRSSEASLYSSAHAARHARASQRSNMAAVLQLTAAAVAVFMVGKTAILQRGRRELWSHMLYPWVPRPARGRKRAAAKPARATPRDDSQQQCRRHTARSDQDIFDVAAESIWGFVTQFGNAHRAARRSDGVIDVEWVDVSNAPADPAKRAGANSKDYARPGSSSRGQPAMGLVHVPQAHAPGRSRSQSGPG